MTTRHNFGFLLLDRVAELLAARDDVKPVAHGATPKLGKWIQYRADGQDFFLLWPLTFMNLSGEAVTALLSAFPPPEEFSEKSDILVAIDDLSLPLGRVRIRAKGSAGGHNGLKSVESHLGHSEYSRLKLGIGRPDAEETVVEYVLQNFSKEEAKALEEVLDFVGPRAIAWLEGSGVSDLSQTLNGWRSSTLERCTSPE